MVSFLPSFLLSDRPALQHGTGLCADGSVQGNGCCLVVAFHHPRAPARVLPRAVVFKHLGCFSALFSRISSLQQNVDCNSNPKVKLKFLWLNKSNLRKVKLHTEGQVCPLASVFWSFGNIRTYSLKTTVVEHQGLGLTRGRVYNIL